eukprot:s2634_g8.t3
MAATDSQICSRCNGQGHRSTVLASTARFYRTCEYCKVVGHSAKACPKLQRRALEKATQQKVVKNQTSDARSESGTSTTASGDSWTSGAWRKPRGLKSKAKGGSGEWQPEHWVLRTEEEREARKLEKKLREIAALQQHFRLVRRALNFAAKLMIMWLVPEPTVEETVTILKGLARKYEAHHRLRYSEEALESCVKLASQYIQETAAVRGWDYCLCGAALEARKELREMEAKKEEAVRAQNYEEAAKCRAEEIKLKKRIKRMVKEAEEAPKEEPASASAEAAASVEEEEEDDEDFQEEIPLVSEADVAQVVSKWTGVPVDKVSTDESARLVALEETLHDRVIGQEEAVTAVSKAVRRARSGLKNPNRPIASFIFCGPTGVGKTELCKALSAAYFGKEDAMIRLDMSEFMERHTVSKLIGSPPGYVGYDEESQLTDGVRRRPYSLVLFDEVEKAHPDVFNLCLQILEDGRLTDSKGRTVSFKNTLIIMTSNVGAKAIEKGLLGGGGLGFAGLEDDVDTSNYQRLKTVVHDELKNFFRPEFLNRLDEIIVFKSLNKQEVAQIAELEFRKVFKLCVEKGIKLSMTDRFKKKVVDEGFNPVYGARPLRRAITRLLEDKLAESFLEMYGPRQFLCGLYGFVVKSGAEAEAWVWTLEDSTQGPEDLEQGRRFRCSFGSGVYTGPPYLLKSLAVMWRTAAWLFLDFASATEDPAQTSWQRNLVRQVHATARQASAAAEQSLYARLDSTDIREALGKCCPSAAALPAPALAERLRAEVRSAEVVSGFSAQVNASWFSFSLDEAERVPYYENLWEIWVRNRAELSNYSFGLDWIEAAYFGLKPFEVHAKPRTMAEARERAPYFALNALRTDAGSPLYGDITVVLRPSVANAVSIVSAFDTGSWAGMCNNSFMPPAGGFDHNCSAYPGHAGLGSLEAFDHLLLTNEQYWHNAHTLERLLVRTLSPSSTLTGPDFVHYFEVLPAARLNFPDHIKLTLSHPVGSSSLPFPVFSARPAASGYEHGVAGGLNIPTEQRHRESHHNFKQQ